MRMRMNTVLVSRAGYEIGALVLDVEINPII